MTAHEEEDDDEPSPVCDTWSAAAPQTHVQNGVVAHVRKRAFTHTGFEREGENERVLIVGQLDWLDVCFDVCNQKDCILCDKDDNRMSIP